MKRLIAVGLALAVVLGGVFIYLRSTAITPELYTGECIGWRTESNTASTRG